jgi:hypothetical protein
LWERLVASAKVGPEVTWSGISGQDLSRLSEELQAGHYQVTGKGTFKVR